MIPGIHTSSSNLYSTHYSLIHLTLELNTIKQLYNHNVSIIWYSVAFIPSLLSLILLFPWKSKKGRQDEQHGDNALHTRMCAYVHQICVPYERAYYACRITGKREHVCVNACKHLWRVSSDIRHDNKGACVREHVGAFTLCHVRYHPSNVYGWVCMHVRVCGCVGVRYLWGSGTRGTRGTRGRAKGEGDEGKRLNRAGGRGWQ